MNYIKKFLFILIIFVFSFSIVLADNISVTGVTLNEHSTTLTVGEINQLIASITPTDATNTTIVWASSNESIATVDNNGLVTAIASGSATITATSVDGSFTDNDVLTINDIVVITHLNLQVDVDVSESCNVTDTDGVSHNYPKGDSYLAICALQTAIDSGSISSALSNEYPSMGLFVTTINNVVADPNSQYWAILQNGNFAQLGLSSLPIVAGDVIILQLQDFSGNNIGDEVTLNINSLITPPPKHHSSSGSYKVEPKIFDIEKAINFLSSQQKEDGSFGEELYTDWVALALATNPEISKTSLEKLNTYLSKNKLSGTMLTDYERRAMALMALNLNPYNINEENYIKKITDSFDGTQFGDKNADNDDIFALIVLQNVGYKIDEKIISETINFLISKQKEDGSWDNSVDLTGAAIEALSNFAEYNKTKEILDKAKNYLKQNQKNDGGWENVSSTAWAMQGILALGEKPTDYLNNDNTPNDYLGLNQDSDGGIKEENLQNRIWQTAYALTSASNKTWNQIMQKFTAPSLASDVVKTIDISTNPLLENINNNSYQAKFSKELKKYNPSLTSEGVQKTNKLEINPTITTPAVKKPNWFKRILNIIFGF